MRDPRTELAQLVATSPLRRIHVVAWRDRDDAEAGGSELHADEVLSRWAAAGLDVTLRTSGIAGLPEDGTRRGYRVRRRDGRYRVFFEVVRESTRVRRSSDAVVEIWNGMPFWSPLWFRGAQAVWLHHVHGEMWQLTLPGVLGRIGWTVESVIAPRIYRNSTIATLSNSSRQEIHDRLGLEATVVPPGISEFFSPDEDLSASPLVVAVGRLVPVKRFDELIRAFMKVHERVPASRLVIAGEGYLRGELESLRHRLGGDDVIALPGRVSDDELRSLYRRAWLTASASLREGWGMSLTEAAACGCPVVATDIAGHRDAVRHGASGLLCPLENLASDLERVLTDGELRQRLRAGSLSLAQDLTWDKTALRLYQLLLTTQP
ncbi:MAG: glycosyltransferase family 4 protein [Acidobacteria bacterium]|nr:glycosyltransferase family 4 protein [Acidobacteriota bacterium]